ncbi:zinc-dependent alcohol dehydrogenase family protein [Pleomorphomonas carboxyditropha]|nr:NAD(P)-dependent alcohol dehydrogenase [Pleomorphomonas carboxyditropha]
MTTAMKVYRQTSLGLEGLQQFDEPNPPSPAGRQVLMRVRASSLNFRDLLSLKNGIPAQYIVNAGRFPLCDGAGEVVAVGRGVTRVKPGEHVAAIFHWDWIAGPIPYSLNTYGRGTKGNDGMLAELALVDESELVLLPEHLSFEEGATLPCAGVTAWYALHGDTPLVPGEDVLVEGTGGVSVFALQFAKISGARVIATTTSPAKMETLRALGADVVIDASRGPGWYKEVLAATHGRGVDVTVEVGGPANWDDAVAATRENGRISMVGALGGRDKAMSFEFMIRGLHLHPTRVGSRLHFEQMNRAMEYHGMRPVIDRIFDFDEVPAAFEYFEHGKQAGKVVIRHG